SCSSSVIIAQEQPVAPPVTGVIITPKVSPTQKTADVSPTADLQKALEGYVAAFNKRDVEGLLRYWSADGIYVTPDGREFHGQAELKQAFENYFQGLESEVRLEIPEYAHELISPKIARETGVAFLYGKETEPLESTYTAYYIREGNEWKLESVKEIEPAGPGSSYEQLQPLEWLIGDWSAENAITQNSVLMKNSWSMNQNFITSNFTVLREGEPVISGVQIIGWDPVAETIRSWIFDSQGGFGTGSWSENEGKWSVRTLFQTSEGEKASAINIYTPVDADSYLYESVSRQRGSELLPSLEEITVNRLQE
ncbi:MAG: nuclear transport factor 2 family protein, partial [Planctomycetaceae bacterium]|nr:nuclear transport factor 2 family protein [Planctomycetaceae bacterium]